MFSEIFLIGCFQNADPVILLSCYPVKKKHNFYLSKAIPSNKRGKSTIVKIDLLPQSSLTRASPLQESRVFLTG